MTRSITAVKVYRQQSSTRLAQLRETETPTDLTPLDRHIRQSRSRRLTELPSHTWNTKAIRSESEAQRIHALIEIRAKGVE